MSAAKKQDAFPEYGQDSSRYDPSSLDVDTFLAPIQSGIRGGNVSGSSSDLGNFSLEFNVSSELDEEIDEDDDERLSDDLEYDDTEIERNTILIPDEDLDDLDGLDDDDLELMSPRQRRSDSDGGDSLNDSDSDITESDTEDGGPSGGEFFDEARDSFDARAFESVMSDLNFEFGSDTTTTPITVEEDPPLNPILSPDDEDIEAGIAESSLLSMRRLSIDHSNSLQQATGAIYKLIWEEGLLGLRLMMTNLYLPAVTRITGKSSMLGIHLVEIGDYLFKIGDQETHRMPFKDVINLLKVVEKPCPLTFRRASDAATPPMDVQSGPGACKNFLWKSPIAQKIASKILELQAEEEAREADAPAVDLDKKYAVQWEDGPLGVSLVANKEVPYPQVTRITGKNRSSQVKDIVSGHYLVSIGNYDTSNGTFNAAIKQLHDVVKPAILYFAPDLRQVSLRQPLGDDEYEQDWEKKQPLGFTLKPTHYGTVVADVGLAKTAKLKQRDPTSPTSGGMNVGDALIWVNDESVENLPFHDALKTLRQAKRPLHLRFRKEFAAIQMKRNNYVPSTATITRTKDSNSPNRKDMAKKIENKEAISNSNVSNTPIPLSAKLHAALKDAVSPFGKKNDQKSVDPKHDDKKRNHKKDRGDIRGSLLGAPGASASASNTQTEKSVSRGFWPSKDKSSATAPLSAPSRQTQSSTHTNTPASTGSRHHPTSSPGTSSAPSPLKGTSSAPSPLKGMSSAPSPLKGNSRQSPISSPMTELSPGESNRHPHHQSHHQQHHQHHQHHSHYSHGHSPGNHVLHSNPDIPLSAPSPSSVSMQRQLSGEHEETKLPVKNIPFEYEITWRAGEELGVTLKPHPETRRAVVARVSGTNDNAKRVALGDILLGANGIPLPPQQKFKDTLSQLSTMPKPTVLRFLRPTRPVFPSSSRQQQVSTHQVSGEYELEWLDHARLGLLFSPHPDTNAPFVSRIESGGDHLRHVQIGDVLVQLGTLDMRNLTFDNCITALTVVTRPVTIRFRRGEMPPRGQP